MVKRHGSALERHRFAGERHGTAIKRHKAARIKDFEGFHDFSPLLGLSGPGGDLRRLGAGGYGKIRNPVKRHKAARILPLCAALQRPGGALRTRARGVGTEKNSHPAPTGLIAILFLSFSGRKSVPVQQRELTIKSIFRSKKHEIPVPPAVNQARPEAPKSKKSRGENPVFESSGVKHSTFHPDPGLGRKK